MWCARFAGEWWNPTGSAKRCAAHCWAGDCGSCGQRGPGCLCRTPRQFGPKYLDHREPAPSSNLVPTRNGAELPDHWFPLPISPCRSMLIDFGGGCLGRSAVLNDRLTSFYLGGIRHQFQDNPNHMAHWEEQVSRCTPWHGREHSNSQVSTTVWGNMHGP